MHVRIGLAAIICAAGFAGAAAHDRPTAKHNYNFHVRPIFVRHCAECHSPGGIAPMSLMTYADAYPWAAAIGTEILERRMPPWQPEEGIGDFHGAKYLNVREIEAIVDWATGGTPQGDPPLEPPANPATKPLWVPGPPDLILKAPTALLPTGVMDETRCVEIEVPRRPLKAIAFVPGNPEMVRRAVVSASCTGDAPPLATWLPGQARIASPDGYAWIVSPNLYLSVHYRKTWRHDGKELQDQSLVGLYFAPADSRPVQFLRLTGTVTATTDMRLISIFAEDAQRVEVNGQPLLQVDRFDPAWNGKYVLREMVEIPRGALISGKAWLEFIEKSGSDY